MAQQQPVSEAFASVHELVVQLRDTDSATERGKIAKKAARELDALELRLNPVERGRKGGEAVAAKRGADYFRELAAKRKTRAGGRPRNNSA